MALNPVFDFKEQAKALLKRLESKPGQIPSPALSLAAVEAALREAFAHGQGAPRSLSHVSRSNLRAPAPAAAVAAPRECPHEWEETFLDGRALGYKCLECGMLQREVQDRCDHYFVATSEGEMCVACRKLRK